MWSPINAAGYVELGYGYEYRRLLMKPLGNLQADSLYILYQEELTAHPLR